nr:SDR family oxidoreductase [Acidisoma sp. S159]
MADLDRLYATVKAEKGAVDIVVANAGFRSMPKSSISPRRIATRRWIST